MIFNKLFFMLNCFFVYCRRKHYILNAKRKVMVYGKNLHVIFPYIFQGQVFMGNNCNFNGMKILGNGSVKIGDNFHSGQECMIITQNHNYDKGSRIPHDETYMLNKITIGKNVWFGNRVIWWQVVLQLGRGQLLLLELWYVRMCLLVPL